jgi:hypothetical protein
MIPMAAKVLRVQGGKAWLNGTGVMAKLLLGCILRGCFCVQPCVVGGTIQCECDFLWLDHGIWRSPNSILVEGRM